MAFLAAEEAVQTMVLVAMADLVLAMAQVTLVALIFITLADLVAQQQLQRQEVAEVQDLGEQFTFNKEVLSFCKTASVYQVTQQQLG